MKNFNLFLAVCFFFILTTCENARSEPTNSPLISNNADTVWNELQQAIIFPKKPLEWSTQPPSDEQKDKFHKYIVDAAMMAANKAKTFYLRFPDSTNVIPAKILECQMLERVFNNVGGTQNSVIAWGNAQDALLADARLTGKDQCDLRLAILNRKQFDHRLDQNAFQIEYEKGLRELIKDNPESVEPYEKLLDLAARSPDGKARSIANEVLALPVSEHNKAIANGILRRLDAVGKPLDMKFVALDGRQVDLSQMKGKVVLVDFWATWCAPCLAELPTLQALSEISDPDRISVITVNVRQLKSQVTRFVAATSLDLPVVLDPKGDISQTFDIRIYPTTLLIDTQGVAQWRIEGDVDWTSPQVTSWIQSLNNSKIRR